MLHSNFGCCIGTIKKSATYKTSGAVERRAVPNGKGNTENHVKGAVKLARRWGASTEQVTERVKHVSDFAYRPDPQRIEDLARIVENELQ